MSRRSRKKLAQKIAEEIKRVINNNRFKINGKFYLLSLNINRSSQEILEELKKKGYSAGYEVLKKVLLETRSKPPNLRQKHRPLPVNYLF